MKKNNQNKLFKLIFLLIIFLFPFIVPFHSVCACGTFKDSYGFYIFSALAEKERYGTSYPSSDNIDNKEFVENALFQKFKNNNKDFICGSIVSFDSKNIKCVEEKHTLKCLVSGIESNGFALNKGHSLVFEFGPNDQLIKVRVTNIINILGIFTI